MPILFEMPAVTPLSEPVSLAEAKAHLRIDDSDQDSAISRMIQVAREWCEDFQGRRYITATLVRKLDAFPVATGIPPLPANQFALQGIIRLPRPPLRSVESITYVDGTGVTQTLAADRYQVDTYSEPGRIMPAYGRSWPVARRQLGAVTITYSAGYGMASDVPAAVKQAMLLLIGHWWENREAVFTGSISKEIEFAVRAMLWPKRVLEFRT